MECEVKLCLDYGAALAGWVLIGALCGAAVSVVVLIYKMIRGL
jgi:hypothetical protein